MKKKICIALAVIGVVISFLAISTMDWYVKELVTDFPTYLYWMLGGGMAMTIPAFIYGITEGK